jgi:hypothetical protein
MIPVRVSTWKPSFMFMIYDYDDCTSTNQKVDLWFIFMMGSKQKSIYDLFLWKIQKYHKS